MARRPSNIFQRGHLRQAYRSGLELAVGAMLASAGIAAEYETVRVPYEVPAKTRHYTPDWVLPNGIILETKGLWDSDDRAKHLLIRQQHPDLDIRMVFSNPNAKLRKGSPTTYASFCEKHGILFSKKEPPTSWLEEADDATRIEAVKRLRRSG